MGITSTTVSAPVREIGIDAPAPITETTYFRRQVAEQYDERRAAAVATAEAEAAHAANLADHLNRYRTNPAQFARDTLNHGERGITDPAGRVNYYQAITSILDAIPAAESQALLSAALLADFHSSWDFMAKVLPQFNEVSHVWYLNNKPQQFWASTTGHLATLTPEAKQTYIDTIRGIVDPAGTAWQQALTPELLAEVLPTFYEEEIEAAQIASVAATKSKNAKMIGLLVLGAFGIFAFTKLSPRGKRKAKK